MIENIEIDVSIINDKKENKIVWYMTKKLRYATGAAIVEIQNKNLSNDFGNCIFIIMKINSKLVIRLNLLIIFYFCKVFDKTY